MTPAAPPPLPAVSPPPAPAVPAPEAREVLLGIAGYYNHSVWPIQVIGVLLMLGALIAVYLRPGPLTDVLTKIALDLAWLWTGVSFFWLHVAGEFRQGYLWGALFLIQGTAFLIDAFFGGLEFRPAASRWRAAACLILAVGTAAAEPALGHLLGRGWPATEIVATAPGPTAAFTAALLLTTAHRPRPWFMLLPAAWAVVAGVRLASSWDWYETLVPAAAGGAAAAIFALSCIVSKTAPSGGEGVPL